MLILRRKKYQEEQQEMAQKNTQMQMQQQQQATMAASQGRQQEEQMKAQMAQASIQAKAQSDMALMKLEYQLKAKYEEQMHKLKMEQLSLTNEGKVDANVVISDAKKESIKDSAKFQSEMIEQKKGNKGVITGEDENKGMFLGSMSKQKNKENMTPDMLKMGAEEISPQQ